MLDRTAPKKVYFNSQPLKEADGTKPVMPDLIFNFNSQPLKEADDSNLEPALGNNRFQLTASQGG